MANKMADKKKNPSQNATRMQSRNRNRMAASKVRSDEMATPKADGDEKEQSKDVKAVARDRDERKVQESKPVRRENRSQSKGPPNWQVRLRSNRSIRFVLDAYYELRHKVTWPSFNEARNMTIAVLLLSAAVGALLGLADFGLQHLYVLLVH
ncbi:MAG: preprotein translocase subunit SecE [Ktedonobacteraceae bacterium]